MRARAAAGLACAMALACLGRSRSASPEDVPRPVPATPGAETAGPLRPGPAGGSPDVRACVDRELARRGLNPYGNPPDIVYPDGPPADEEHRVEYVARRYPDIRTECRVGPW